MRVAIVGDYPLDPSRIWGGEQAAFAYLVRGLSKIEGLEIHVVTLSDAASAASRAEPGGPTVHALPRLPRGELFRRYPAYRARLRAKLAEIRADAVHAQGAIHHGFAALRSGYPAAITVHGIQSEDCKHQKNWYLRARKRFVAWWLERYNLKRTRYLIAISRYVTDYFAGILRPDAEVFHIPNAIDERFFELEDASDGRAILFAGRVVRRKRPFDLVRAFARIATRVPSARLRIAGECDSEPEHAGEIREFVRLKGLEDRVEFLGSLPEERVLEEFSRAALLALPSAQETTPMVIAQAMAASKPVVATPVGGVAEMVKDGESGLLVPAGDVEALAAAMLRILEDADLRARLGREGRRLAEENYRAERVARRTYEVYRRMTGA